MTLNTLNICDLVKQTATPALFAKKATGGMWKFADHLLMIDRALTDAVTSQGPRRLVITMPPRHGKSELCSRFFPAWFLGTFPDHRIILASYEADFAKSWGRRARDLLEQYGDWFGISVDKRSSAANQWNITGRAGGMTTAGVGGPITGRGANLLIVDDPVKNAQDADSPTIREKTWDWWLSTALTRLEPDSVVIVIQTRWHEDDLAGRILGNTDDPEEWHLIKMPAISDEGNALWPARWPIKELEKVRQRLIASGGLRWWQAMYQQEPTAPQGEMFDVRWFHLIEVVDMPPEIYKEGVAVRYWDKAATEGGGAYTSGVLMVKFDGRYFVPDVKRGQWSSFERNNIMKETTERDARHWKNYTVWTEQEPGSGGKESAELTVKNLAGYRVKLDRVTGDKETRAGPWSSACEGGLAYVVKGSWLASWLEEHRTFPRGTFKDQVDASAGGFNKLAGASAFNLADWLEAGAL